MRALRRYPFLLASLAMALAVLPAVASSAGPSIEAVNVGLYSHYWSPSQVSVATGGTVTLSNSSEVAHGIEWRSALKPTCEEGAGKVPVGTAPAASGTKWSGICTFTQPGTYTFYCTVHGPEMTGTVTVKNPGEPVATSEPATAVGETEVTLNGTVTPEGHETTYFFKYGLTTAYENGSTPAKKLTSTSTPEAVSAPLGGLAQSTTYHYQLVAENSSGTAHSADGTFTTASPPGPPTATTGIASSIGETTATLKGTVNPDGRPTKYFFEWGLTASYGQLTSELSAGEDHTGHAVSAALAGLAPGTVYHYRLLANNGSGPSTGIDQTFTTASPPLSPPPPPTTPSPQVSPPAGVVPQLVAPPAPKLEPPTVSGPVLIPGSLKLTAPRHSTSIHGVLLLGGTVSGGSFEVDLLVKGASLAKSDSPSKLVRVGSFLRRPASSGRVSFAISLSAQAKRALAHRRSLPVTVKITLTPPHGQATILSRTVTLRA